MNDQAALDLLQAIVGVPSVSGHEAAVAQVCVEWMQQFGLDAHIDAVGNAIGMAGTGSETVVLLGHIDTVAGWIPLDIREGALWGRGVVDAKGCMATFMVATARALAAGNLNRRVVIAGCVEEEIATSRGAHFLADTWPAPQWCVIGEPSGIDRVTLGYKGNLRLTLSLVQATAHSAHQAATAAERACEIWQMIVGDAVDYNQGYIRTFDQLLPTLVALNTSNDGLNDHATLDINVRLPLDCSPEAYLARLNAYLPASVVVHATGGVSAYTAERSSPLARQFIRALREYDLPARFVQKTGTSDMNVVGPVWGCPIVAYGPGDAALDHTPNEHLVLQDYLQAIKILTHVLSH